MLTDHLAESLSTTQGAEVRQVRHVITCEYPPQPGGVSDYTYTIAAALSACGDDVNVWCPSCLGDAPPADGVTVHRDLGTISTGNLWRVGRLLDNFPSPRRLLVQWVPHGYGYRSMNLIFCGWVWFRAAWHRDTLEIMVHEPYLPFSNRSWRQNAAALIHRLMALVLLQQADRVFVAIPEWERRLRPYTLNRNLPFQWLPVISSITDRHDPGSTAKVRDRYAAPEKFLIGHFGTFGSSVTTLLEPVLNRVIAAGNESVILLMGIRSKEYRAELIGRSPGLAHAVHATGSLSTEELTNHLSACDLLLQPYPDGVSTRRTSLFAGLSHGRPIVTTIGELTEPFWSECGAVTLVAAGDSAAFVSSIDRLRTDPAERCRLGKAARELYDERFEMGHLISILRSTPR